MTIGASIHTSSKNPRRACYGHTESDTLIGSLRRTPRVLCSQRSPLCPYRLSKRMRPVMVSVLYLYDSSLNVTSSISGEFPRSIMLGSRQGMRLIIFWKHRPQISGSVLKQGKNTPLRGYLNSRGSVHGHTKDHSLIGARRETWVVSSAKPLWPCRISTEAETMLTCCIGLHVTHWITGN
jgi:hypothetical protein